MKAGPTWSRLITEARVVAALIEGRNRFDLAPVLWAVKTKSRTLILAALFDGPATTQEIRQRTGINESTAYRALKGLREAGFVVSRRKVRSYSGPRANVYEISSGKSKKEAPE